MLSTFKLIFSPRKLSANFLRVSTQKRFLCSPNVVQAPESISNISTNNNDVEKKLPWFETRVPTGFWKEVSNQTEYMNWAAKELGFKKTSDWYKVNSVKFKRLQGATSILHAFKNQFLPVLKSAYPSETWLSFKFEQLPKGYWNDMKNQREYMTWYAKEMGLEEPLGWYKACGQDLTKTKEGFLLMQNYNGSFTALLRAIYPEIEWDHSLFGKGEENSWTNRDKVEEAVQLLGERLNVKTLDDWYNINTKQFDEAGGTVCLEEFEKLLNILLFVYTDHPWDQSRFTTKGKKATKRWMTRALREIFKGKNVIENHMDPELYYGTSKTSVIELDVWLPELNLAFIFQVSSVVHDLHPAFSQGTVNNARFLHLSKDQKIAKACEKKGISLIFIPSWWDGGLESLKKTINEERSDLFADENLEEFEAIPDEMPPPEPKGEDYISYIATSGLFAREKNNENIQNMLMHGRDWTEHQDPTGWYFSEKFDGVRAYWDGTAMYSKYGIPLPVPKEWTNNFPMIPLDGELWMGYESFDALMSALNRRRVKNTTKITKKDPAWNEIKYCVFDTTTHGPITERHAFLTSAIERCKSTNLEPVVLTRCESKEHLKKCLQDVVDKKGEGLMLYHPTESHQNGRTNYLLKVKHYLDEETIFQRLNPTSFSFICLSSTGVESIVKCTSSDYEHPPPQGTIVTVRHSGLFKVSGKFKYPFVLRVH